MPPKRSHEAGGNRPKPGGEGVLVRAEECAISNHVIGPTIEFACRAPDRSRKFLLALRFWAKDDKRRVFQAVASEKEKAAQGSRLIWSNRVAITVNDQPYRMPPTCLAQGKA